MKQKTNPAVTLTPEELKGDWALVTGASSGIGREFCVQLAAAGVNLVMVARRTERMDALAKQLEQRHDIRTLVLTLDLALPHAAAQVKTAVEQKGIRIRLLCNNAAYGPWGRFENTTADTYERVIQLIAGTTVSMCRLFLDDLASFPSAVVINLSSPAALQPVPYKAVYSAVKTCVHNFSLALYAEWRNRGIIVQTLLPGPTESELDTLGGAYKCGLTEVRNPPAEVVKESLSHLSQEYPFVTTNKGTFKQRAFAGLLPAKTILRYVEEMFRPPAGQ